jgi:hypothetical protein
MREALLLRKHTRKANLNGGQSAAWYLLCSIFQGCVWAPEGWGIAAEPEARAQHADPRVHGIQTARSPHTMLSCRFADDTANAFMIASTDAVLDNSCVWCMASGGATHPHKQALMWRGAKRNSGKIWEKSFDQDPAPPEARTRFVHAHGVLESLGILDGGTASPGTPDLPTFDPTSNTPQRPSQKQLDIHRRNLEWDKVTKRFINALKLQSRNYYTYQARTAVLTTFAESILWYLFEIHPLPEDSQRSKYLEAAAYAYLWKGGLPDCLGDVHNTEIAKVNQSYASKLKRNKVAKPWRQGGMY